MGTKVVSEDQDMDGWKVPFPESSQEASQTEKSAWSGCQCGRFPSRSPAFSDYVLE